MALWIVPPVGILEPCPAPEFYADDIGAIELNGDNIRLYMVAEQLPLDIGTGPHKIVVAKIVRPICSVPFSIGQLAQCLHRPSRGPFVPRVV